MASFSGGLKLGDLDDFIALSQECIKPLIEAAEGGSWKLGGESDARLAAKVKEQEVPLVQKPNLIKSKQSSTDAKAQIGQVTLSDCLACAGCVTSAETVLLQEQSADEFVKRAATAPLTVVSVSAEARASLAVSCGLSPLQTMEKIATGLQRLGATYVLEGSAAEAFALLEGKAEFVRRYRASGGKLPLLTSHCPGWTCYAEKVVDPAVLPHMAPLRPPQQIQGRLVKTCLLEAHNRRRLHRWWRARSPLFAAESGRWLRPVFIGSFADADGARPLEIADVYHVSVQPCFDKKLEAARPGFTLADVREVDTVLTATELADLMQRAAAGEAVEASAASAAGEGGEGGEGGDSSSSTAKAAMEALPPCGPQSEVLTDLLLGSLRGGRPQPLLCAVRRGAGNGGFLEHVFREAALDLFQAVVPADVEFTDVRNEDMREVSLRDPATGKVLLKFVTAYGFRNIQHVIQKLGKQTAQGQQQGAIPEPGHFVEIMACPGGCLNGGGQMPAAQGGVANGGGQAGRREHLSRMADALSFGEGVAVMAPAEHPLVLPLYRYVASAARAGKDAAGSLEMARSNKDTLETLVGSEAIGQWLAADWRSLKVNSEGKAIVSTSALKW